MRPDFARDHSGLRLAAVQFVQFTAVGGVGLFVDMGALWVALQILALDAYAGRVFSYLVAATFTWVCNRAITFKSARPGGLLGQWARYLMANAFGAVVNFAIYALVVRNFRAWFPSLEPSLIPYVGVALGSAAGLIVNFTASKRFVFR